LQGVAAAAQLGRTVFYSIFCYYISWSSVEHRVASSSRAAVVFRCCIRARTPPHNPKRNQVSAVVVLSSSSQHHIRVNVPVIDSCSRVVCCCWWKTICTPTVRHHPPWPVNCTKPRSIDASSCKRLRPALTAPSMSSRLNSSSSSNNISPNLQPKVSHQFIQSQIKRNK